MTKLGRRSVCLVLCASFAFGVGSAQAAPGSLDPSFGIGGTETIPIGSVLDHGRGVVVQPDGKIVGAGDSNDGTNPEFALVRVNPNGSLDTGFGAGGKVTTAVGSSGSGATSLVLQPDGKLVAAGYGASGTNAADFALVRYDANGSLDTGFGTGGKVTTDIFGSDDEASALALQPDGKIVVVGQTFTGSVDEFAVVRYNANGSIDTGFTGGGAALTPIGAGNAFPTAVALQPDGKIVVAGYASNGTDDDYAVVRYDANGGLDSTFGTNGVVTTDIDSLQDFAQALAIQSDGKIVVAGASSTGGKSGTYYFSAVRYNADGSLDPGFGSGGKIMTLAGTQGGEFSAIALQPDGKIVLAGSATGGSTGEFDFQRLNANGSPDAGFGSGGQVLVPLGNGGAGAAAVALQGNGKVVAAGSSASGGIDVFTLVRVLGNALSVTKTGSGAGTVTSIPAGISCGSSCSAPFAAVPVTLTPKAQAGSVFTGWSGGGCSGTGTCHVQLSSDQHVTATFTVLKTLTVTKAGTGSGAVSSSPAGIACGSTCAHTFAAGTSVTLTAQPSPGSGFSGWSGACNGTGSCKLTMSTDHDVTATFATACVVPKVKGKALRAAKRAIKAGHCSVGKVTKAFSTHVKKGHVIAQKPRPGSQRAAGAKVSLKISRGRKH